MGLKVLNGFDIEGRSVIDEQQTKSAIRVAEEDVTGEIIGAAMSVHRELGPGLLESAYQVSRCHELRLRGIPFRSRVELPVA